MSSTQKTTFKISNYIKTNNPYKSNLLGFSRIVGTDDIFMERFHYQRVLIDSESNIGAVEKRTIASLRLEYAWSQLSKEQNIALEERYIKLIEQNYYGFSTIRDALYPVVKGFHQTTFISGMSWSTERLSRGVLQKAYG